MNRAYRLVWNASQQAWVPAPEFARARGKSGKVRSLVMAVALATTGSAMALPTGGQIGTGQGSIAQSGNTLTVNQNSSRLGINWTSFNIGSAETVNFNQPGSSAVALNRVTGAGASSIFGHLNANGQVFLLNSSGVLFGAGAQVNVGGLVASTLNLSDADFAAGKLHFAGTAGNVVNQGSLNAADGGYIALLGGQVSNQGSISARLGSVDLSAGSDMTLDFSGDGLLQVQVNQGTLHALAENRQLVQADGGSVTMSAKAAGTLAAAVVNNSGVVEAEQLNSHNGVITLEADDTHGLVSNSGQLKAASVNATAHGILQSGNVAADTIALTASQSLVQTSAGALTSNGGKIAVDGGANTFVSGSLDASGSYGGALSVTGNSVVLAGASLSANGTGEAGSIKIGGGIHGVDASLANADSVLVNPSTQLSLKGADASLAVWSQQSTGFFGSVKTGADANVEISSKGTLTMGGAVHTGDASHVLLDPTNIIITNTAPAAVYLDLAQPDNIKGASATSVEIVTNFTVDKGASTVVVTSPGDSLNVAGAGAVFTYNPTTGALVSALYGTQAGDSVGSGGVLGLSNGNFVVSSPLWGGGAGAVTWMSATTGFTGTVAATNSLVGSTTDAASSTGTGDRVGAVGNGRQSSLTKLINTSDYLVISPYWNSSAGAVTYGNGTTGTSGVVSSTNSVVGAIANDKVGAQSDYSASTVVLNSGNIVIASPGWNGGMGAVTLMTPTTTGTVSASNSLVGSTAGDKVGYDSVTGAAASIGVTALPSGNFVVTSPNWSGSKGAITLVNVSTGLTGAVSNANSLVGTTGGILGDKLGARLGDGESAVTVLTNGYFVVDNYAWNNSAGAVTYGNPATTLSGSVTYLNSFVGVNDTVNGYATHVGGGTDGKGTGGVVELNNGNYVINSPDWTFGSKDGGITSSAGAVTWASGTTGLTGYVSSANSLEGTASSDRVGSGGITGLNNGNYVVVSPNWSGSLGAVTWGSGTAGVSGTVSSANSLVGSVAGDSVGSAGVVALTSGNYLVLSPQWTTGTGAVTWRSGATANSGTISIQNSLVGKASGDYVGALSSSDTSSDAITLLNSGNYVVSSPLWGSGAGAVSFGGGATGLVGVVSSTNSLVGDVTNGTSAAGDHVGALLGNNSGNGVVALASGGYLVVDGAWHGNTGSVSYGSSSSGVTGVISASTSLVGSTAGTFNGSAYTGGDQVGTDGSGRASITALTNGNIVVASPMWSGTTGAATWINASTGLTGAISSTNSLTGSAAGDYVGGSSTAASGGFNGGVQALNGGNYLVASPNWGGGKGAVTWGDGTGGKTVGAVSASNSLVGSSATDGVGGAVNGSSTGVVQTSDGNYLVVTPNWTNTATGLVHAGAVTWGNASVGLTGTISAGNSLIGGQYGSADSLGSGGITLLSNGNYLINTTGYSTSTSNGSVNGALWLVASPANAASLLSTGAASMGLITPAQLALVDGTGSTLTLQATEDITVQSATSVGGALNLVAGGTLAVNASLAAGGALDLESGGNMTINAAVTGGNGLTIIAGETGKGLPHPTLGTDAGNVNGGSLTINNNGTATTGQLTTTAGAINVQAPTGGITTQGSIQSAAGLAVAANGALAVAGTVATTSGDATFSSTTSTVDVEAGGKIGGNLTTTSKGTLFVNNTTPANSLTASGNVLLSTALGDIDEAGTLGSTAGNLAMTVTSTYGITIHGPVSASGTLAVNTNAGNILVANDNVNYFGALSSSGSELDVASVKGTVQVDHALSAGTNLNVQGGAGVTLGAISLNGTAIINSNSGGVTLTGTVNNTASGGISVTAPLNGILANQQITSNGPVTLSAQSNINLDNGVASKVDSAAGSITITSANGGVYADGLSAAVGDLTISANNTVSTLGTLSASGNLNITVNAGTITANQALSSGADMNLTSASDINLIYGAGTQVTDTVGGNLNVTTQGNFGAGGVTTSIGSIAVKASGNVQFDQAATSAGGISLVAGSGNITVVNDGTTNLGKLTSSSGPIVLTAGNGNINVYGSTLAGGPLTATAEGAVNFGQSVTVAGNVTLSSTGTSAQSLTGDVTLGGAFHETAPRVAVASLLLAATTPPVVANISSSGGSVYASGVVNTVGDLTITAINSINLTNGSTTAATSVARNFSATASTGGVTLGQLTAGGTAQVTAANGITAYQAQSASGALTYSTNTGNINIVNDGSANLGSLTSSTGGITLTATSSTIYEGGTVNAAGALTASALGDVRFNQLVTAGKAVTLNSTGTGTTTGTVYLGGGLNDTSTASDVVNLQSAGGAIQVSGPVTVPGNLMASAASDINLAYASGTSSVDSVGGALTANSSGGGLSLPQVTVTGAVTATTATGAQLYQPLKAASISITSTGSGSINLQNNGSSYLGSVTTTTGDMLLEADGGSVNLQGGVTSAGALTIKAQDDIGLAAGASAANAIALTTTSTTNTNSYISVTGALTNTASGDITLTTTDGTIYGNLNITSVGKLVGSSVYELNLAYGNTADQISAATGVSLTSSQAGVDVGGAVVKSGDINIQGSTGVSVYQPVTASGAMQLSATAGSVNVNNNGSSYLGTLTTQSGNLTLNASNSVYSAGSTTSAGLLSISAGNAINVVGASAAGSVTYTAANNITSGGVSATGPVSMTTTSTTNTGSSIVVNGAISSTGSGDVTLTSAGGAVDVSANIGSGGNLVVKAQGNADLAYGNTATADTVAGQMTVQANSNYVAVGAVSTASGAVSLQSGADISIYQPVAAATSIGLTAVGSVNVYNNGSSYLGSLQSKGGDTTLTAGNSISLGSVSTSAGAYAATAVNSINIAGGVTAANGISLTTTSTSNTGGMTISGLLNDTGKTGIQLASADGGVNDYSAISTLGNLKAQAANGINLAFGTVNVVDTVGGAFSATSSAGGLTLGGLTTGSGGITANVNGSIYAYQPLQSGAGINLTASAGDISIQNNGSSYLGSLVANAGDITLVSSGNLNNGGATTSSGLISATAGNSINMAAATATGAVTLSAVNSVGSGGISTPGPISLTTTSTTNTSGSINVSGLLSSTGTGGITLASTAGTVDVNSNISSGGNIAVTALYTADLAYGNVSTADSAAGKFSVTTTNAGVGLGAVSTAGGAINVQSGADINIYQPMISATSLGLTAAGSIYVNNNGTSYQGLLQSKAGDTVLSAGNAIALGSLSTSAGAFAATGVNGVSLTGVQAGNGITLATTSTTNTSSNVSISGALNDTSASGVTLKSADGSIYSNFNIATAGDLSASAQFEVNLAWGNTSTKDAVGGKATLTSALGGVTLGGLVTSAGAVSAKAGTGIAVYQPVTSAAGLTLQAGSGDISVSNNASSYLGSLTAKGGDMLLTSSGGSIRDDSALVASGQIQASALNNVAVGGAQAGAAISLSTTSTTNTGSQVSVSGALSNGGTTDITLASADGGVAVTGNITSVGNLTASAVSDVNLAYSNTGAVDTVAGAFTATSTSGTVSAGSITTNSGAISAQGGVGVTVFNPLVSATSLLLQGGAVSVYNNGTSYLGSLNAKAGDITITSTGNTSVQGATTSTGKLTITSGDSITMASEKAAADVTENAVNTVSVADITTAGPIALSTTSTTNTGSAIYTSGALSSSGTGGVQLNSADGGINVGGSVNTGGAASMVAAQGVNLSYNTSTAVDTTTGGLTATSTAGSIMLTTINAGGPVTVQAATGVTGFAPVSSGAGLGLSTSTGDINLYNNGSSYLASLTTTSGDMTLGATTGSINLQGPASSAGRINAFAGNAVGMGATTATGNVSFSAVNTVNASGISTAGSIFLSTSSTTNTSSAINANGALTSTGTAGVQLSSKDGYVSVTGLASTGGNFSASAGSSISIASGITATGSVNLQAGQSTIDVEGNVSAGNGLTANAAGNLQFDWNSASSTSSVTGPLALSSLAGTVYLNGTLAAGQTDLSGATGIQLYGTQTVSGPFSASAVLNDVYMADKVTATGDITLNANAGGISCSSVTTSSSGHIVERASGVINMAGLSAAHGISLISSGNNVVVSNVLNSSGSELTEINAGGSVVVEANGSMGGNLSITAATNIGFDVYGAGKETIQSAGAVSINANSGRVDTNGTLKQTNAAQSVSIAGATGVAINGSVNAAGALSIVSSGGNISVGGASSTGGDLQVQAASGIALNNNLTATGNALLTSSTGDISIGYSGQTTSAASLNAASLNASTTPASKAAIRVYAPVTLSGSTASSLNGDGGVDIEAAVSAPGETVSLTGTLGITNNSTLAAGGIAINQQGDLTLQGSGSYQAGYQGLTLNSATGSVNAQGTFTDQGSLTVTAANAINVNSAFSAQDMVLTAGTGGVIVNAAGSLTTTGGSNPFTKTTSTAKLAASAASISLSGAVTSAGALTLNASQGDVNVSSATSAAGVANLSASGNINLGSTLSSGGALTASAGSTVNLTGAATVTSTATGNALTLDGNAFSNTSTAAATALSAANGRWLVYSASPGNTQKGGLTSNFRHYNATYATYSPTAVTETGDGFIYASQPGTLTVTVNSGGVTSSVYGNAAPVFGYTLAGFADSEDTSSNIGLTTSNFNAGLGIHAGSYKIAYQSGLSSSVGYSFTTDVQPGGSDFVYSILPRPVTVGGSAVYNGTTTIAGSGLAVTNTVSGDTLTLGGSVKLAGKDVVVGGQPISDLSALTLNSSDYTVVGGSGSVTVTPAGLTITPTAGQSKVYGTNDPTSGFAYTSSGLLGTDTLSGNLGRSSGETAGAYGYNLGSLNTAVPADYTISLGTGSSFAISRAALTINPNGGQSKVYGANDSASGFTYSSTGLVSGVTPTYWNSSGQLVADSTINDSLSGNLGRAAGEAVGTYAFNLGNLSVSAPADYTLSLGTGGSFGISKAALTINASGGQSKVYGTNDSASGFTYTSTGLVSGVTPTYWNSSGQLVADSAINDSLSGHLGRGAGETVGSYAFNLGNLAVSAPADYTLSLGTGGSFGITKAALTINPNAGQGKVYGTNDSASGFTYSSTGLVSGVTPTYWNSSGQLVADSAINDSLSGHLGRGAGETVGTYAFNLGNLAVSAPSDYTLSLGTGGSFGITKAALTINPNAGQGKVYGTSDSSSGFTYSSTGLVSGVTPTYWNSSGQLVADSAINDSLSGHLGRGAGETVGSYAFNLGNLAVSAPSDYTLSLGTGSSFGITKASLAITPNAGQSKVYGTNDSSSGFTYSSTGLVSGVTPTYWSSSGQLVADSAINDSLSGHLGRGAGETVGTYAFNLGNLAVSAPSDYTLSLGTGSSFGITKASLTINASGGQSKVYGTNDSASGFTYSSNGLVSGVTPTYWNSSGQLVADSAINDSLSGTLGRAAGEAVGTYAFNLGNLSVSAPADYTLSLGTGGSFGITKAALTINPNAGQSKVYGTNDSSSGFTYSSTGLVSGVTPTYWNSSGQLVADSAINDSLSGHLGRGAGETVGTYAFNLGNLAVSSLSDYTLSLGTGSSFGITKANLTINASGGQSKVYGTNDSASGFTYSSTGLVSGVTPTYWNSSGQLVADTAINDSLSGHLGRGAGETVGSYAFNLGNLAVSAPSDYTLSLGTGGSFGITKAALTINATGGQSKVYGTNDSASGFTYSSTGLVSGVTPTYWNSSGQLVADTAINDSLSGHLGRGAGETVGTYAFNLGNLAVSAPSDYTLSLGTGGSFGITKAALTINPNAGQSKVYGTNDSSSGFTYSSTGLVSGVTPTYWNSSGQLVADSAINDSLSGHLGRGAGETVGSYAFNLGNLAVSAPSDYTLSLGTGSSFGITKASLAITPNAGQSKVYGTNDSGSGFTYTSTGLLSGVTPSFWNSSGLLVADTAINDSLSGNLGRASGEAVGSYAFNLGNLAVSAPANYTLGFGTGNSFGITKATVTVSPVSGQSKVYGSADPNFSYTSSGVVIGVTPKFWNASGQLVADSAISDALSGSLTRAAGQNVGTYAYGLGSLAVSNASNYNALVLNASSFAITPATLTLSGSEVYNGTTLFSGSNLLATGVGGETFSLAGAAVAGNSGNVQTAQPLAGLGTLTLGSSSNGGLAGNYQALGVAGSKVSITPATLTLSGVTASNKVYNGNTSDNVTASLLGILNGDAVSLSSSGLFASKDVSTAIPVAATFGIGGAKAGNYVLQVTPAQQLLSANITPLSLSVSGTTVASKVYDGTTAATVTSGTLGGVLAGDTVNLASASGVFASANVGSNVSVAVSYGLGGAQQGDYVLAGQTLSAAITPLGLSISGSVAANKVYDGTLADVVTAGTLSGVIGSDSVTVSKASGVFASKDVGSGISVTPTYTLTGAQAGNYVLTGAPLLSANITPRSLSVSGSKVADKVYDGTTAANILVGTVSGLIAGDSVQLSGSGNFASKNVGNGLGVPVSYALSGAQAADYNSPASELLSGNITPATLTVSNVQGTKLYDGTNALANPVFTFNSLPQDQVQVTGNAVFGAIGGSNLALSASNLAISGADASNYTLTNTSVTGTGSITPAPYAGSPATGGGMVQSVQQPLVIASVPADWVGSAEDIGQLIPAVVRPGVGASADEKSSMLNIVDGGIRLP